MCMFRALALATPPDSTLRRCLPKRSFLEMVWLPDHIWRAQKKGKGKGKGGPVQIIYVMKGKGKGKGRGKKNLSRISVDEKVWVGGLSESTTWKELEEHMNQAGKTTWVEVFKKGTACVAYKTAEEATNAISTMNGSELGGSSIEVDVWVKEEK